MVTCRLSSCSPECTTPADNAHKGVRQYIGKERVDFTCVAIRVDSHGTCTCITILYPLHFMLYLSVTASKIVIISDRSQTSNILKDFENAPPRLNPLFHKP